MTYDNPGLHDIERMMCIFMYLDKNNDGMVDREELEAHCKEYKIDPNHVDAWLKRFDTDADGKISMAEFCRGLNIPLTEIVNEKKERDLQATKPQDAQPKFEDVEIISCPMTWVKQEEIIKKFKELVSGDIPNDEMMSTVTEKFQEFLNQRFGRVWQCVMLSGSYWMKFTHEPFMSIQFRYKGKLIVLAWRCQRE